MQIDAVDAKLPFTAGYMRGSPQREFAFFTESFIDELAHAAGMEPLAFRMSMLGGNGRLARCLQAAARLANWDGGGPGSTMGIAGAPPSARTSASSQAQASATTSGSRSTGSSQRSIAGAWSTAALVEQQIEAGLIWALAQATVPAPEWVAGMPRARPIGGIGLPRLGDAPEIVVEIIPSSEPPGGRQRAWNAAACAGVANAIHAGSGKRMRSLPFDRTARMTARAIIPRFPSRRSACC